MKVEEKKFNIFDKCRPKVLLLGNGINQAFNGMDWNHFLNSIKVKDFSLCAKKYCLPMSLKAVLLSKNTISTKLKELTKEKTEGDIDWNWFVKTNPELRELIRKLVRSNFDYVLTTNYSYEIEASILDLDKFSRSRVQKMMNFHEVDHAQTQFLLNTFNLVEDIPIWHIHGEARKPDSMIIGHSFYGKQLRRCIERLDGDANRKGKSFQFKDNQRDRKPQAIGSWVDAFVLGDVYIVGFGLDFSESDLWWLLDFKSRNKDICGKTVLFQPIDVRKNKDACSPKHDPETPFFDESECRQLLLEEVYGVKVENLDFHIHENNDYKKFYASIVNNLKKIN